MKTYSQSGQDLFVINQLNFLKNGLFVDIAAGHPKTVNNTCLLEEDYGWDGISIELDSSFNSEWEKRKTTFINKDAFDIDYDFIFGNFLKKHKKNTNTFDYLSLDLEPASLTNKLLHMLPLKKYKFKVITYEHDFYKFGDIFKNDTKSYLLDLGYKIYKENISNSGLIYEDWYIFEN